VLILRGEIQAPVRRPGSFLEIDIGDLLAVVVAHIAPREPVTHLH
jgi:hypothetical protein